MTSKRLMRDNQPVHFSWARSHHSVGAQEVNLGICHNDGGVFSIDLHAGIGKLACGHPSDCHKKRRCDRCFHDYSPKGLHLGNPPFNEVRPFRRGRTHPHLSTIECVSRSLEVLGGGNGTSKQGRNSSPSGLHACRNWRPRRIPQRDSECGYLSETLKKDPVMYPGFE